MVPLFFAVGQLNHELYALYYQPNKEAMPQDAGTKFMAGNHTMHYKRDQLNGIWSGMAIEATCKRFGHSKRGIIGITTKPETVRYRCTTLLYATRFRKGHKRKV